jgi:hypothetical protein
MLLKRSISASILPIFSNIPFSHQPSLPPHSESHWNFIVFGAIHPEWQPGPLFEQIEIARHALGIESCSFISVGRISEYAASFWDSLSALPFPAFSFRRLGMLSAEQVSFQLQCADFGLCVVPDVLIEKSGSVAAMLAHGLPIIVSRLTPDSDHWHNELKRRGHYILLDHLFIQSLASAKHYVPIDQATDSARSFLKSLKLI